MIPFPDIFREARWCEISELTRQSLSLPLGGSNKHWLFSVQPAALCVTNQMETWGEEIHWLLSSVTKLWTFSLFLFHPIFHLLSCCRLCAHSQLSLSGFLSWGLLKGRTAATLIMHILSGLMCCNLLSNPCNGVRSFISLQKIVILSQPWGCSLGSRKNYLDVEGWG